MIITLASYIGGFVRWLFKLGKTKLSDEFNDSLKPLILKSYDSENIIIGYITVCIILFIMMNIVHYVYY